VGRGKLWLELLTRESTGEQAQRRSEQTLSRRNDLFQKHKRPLTKMNSVFPFAICAPPSNQKEAILGRFF